MSISDFLNDDSALAFGHSLLFINGRLGDKLKVVHESEWSPIGPVFISGSILA